VSTRGQRVDVDEINKVAKRLVERFYQFTKHSPKVLRDSMMMSYCKAIDEMMQAMDSCKLDDPVPMTIEKPVHLVDSDGHAL
jgi:hypothetical protein